MSESDRDNNEFTGMSVTAWRQSMRAWAGVSGSGIFASQSVTDIDSDIRHSRTLLAIGSLPAVSSDAILQYGPWLRTYATPAAQTVFGAMGRFPRPGDEQEQQLLVRFMFNVAAIAYICRTTLPPSRDAWQQVIERFTHAFVATGSLEGVVHVHFFDDDEIVIDFFQLRNDDGLGFEMLGNNFPFYAIHMLRLNFNDRFSAQVRDTESNPTYTRRVGAVGDAVLGDTYYELLRLMYYRIVEYPSHQLSVDDLRDSVDARLASSLVQFGNTAALFVTAYNELSSPVKAPARIGLLSAVVPLIYGIAAIPRDSRRVVGQSANSAEFVFNMRCQVLQEFRFTPLQGADTTSEYLWLTQLFDRFWAPVLHGIYDGTLQKPSSWSL